MQSFRTWDFLASFSLSWKTERDSVRFSLTRDCWSETDESLVKNCDYIIILTSTMISRVKNGKNKQNELCTIPLWFYSQNETAWKKDSGASKSTLNSVQLCRDIKNQEGEFGMAWLIESFLTHTNRRKVIRSRSRHFITVRDKDQTD